MPDLTGYYDEARLRGIPSPQTSVPASQMGNYSSPYAGLSPDGVTPLLINQGTYTNGRTFAGTGSTSNPGGGNVPMSDASYRLLMSNLGQIPTDRDVLGGGHYGIRGWLNDHPEGTLAAFIAAAAGGAALAGGAGGAGAGGGALTTMTPAEQAAITSGLTNVPAGVGAGSAAGAGAGSLAGFGGAGTAGAPANLAADFAGTQLGAPANGLVLEGGAGTISGSGLTAGLTKYGNQLSSLLGNGSGGGGATQIPAGMFGSQVSTPQPRQAPTAQRPILPGMQPLPQAVGRRPYNFRGTTIWM